MKLIINRRNPKDGKKWDSSFNIDKNIVSGMTIMDLLIHVSEEYDNTLSFYSHSACNHGICLRCIVSLNGKNVLACTTKVPDTDTLTIGPMNGKEVVKDLVV